VQRPGVVWRLQILVAALLSLAVVLVGRQAYAAALAITPPSATVSPRQTQTFTATGGSGSGFTWSLSTNASGGSISAAGVYTAGATASVSDVVQVTDSASAVATATVTVGSGVTVSPATATVAAGGTQTFTAAGGVAPYGWALTTDGSGSTAAITAVGGVYVAGTSAGTDVVTATDAVGNTGTATITVTVKQGPIGSQCTASDECPSGSPCVDGVCCSTACSGQCQACNTAGNVGTCVTITGPPVGTRPACPQSESNNACSSKVCDGTSATSCTSLVGKTTTCGVASCIDGVGTPGAVCLGDGGCEVVVPRSCDLYACVSDKCATSCTNSSECSPGNYCEVSTRKCIRGPTVSLDASADASTSAPVATTSSCAVGRAPWGGGPLVVIAAVLGALGLCWRRREGGG
jgi:hypothetical protein